MTTTRLTPVLAALLLAACADAAPSPGGVESRDSAGIRITHAAEPVWAEGEGWSVERAPFLEIGRTDGPAEYTLHEVHALDRLDDGRIVLAQRSEIRVYDAAGGFERLLGRTGSGPGEFQFITGAAACRGRIYAVDLLQPHVTVYTADGVLAATFRDASLDPNATLGLAACAGGRMLLSMTPRGASADTLVRPPSWIVATDDTGAISDTLFTLAGIETYRGLLRPFGRRQLIVGADSLIYVADTGTPEVRVHGSDGRLRRIHRLGLEPRRVQPDDIARLRDDYLRGVPEALANTEILPRLNAVSIPETMPFFADLSVTRDGTMWLRAYYPFKEGEDPTWLVVNADGAWLGDVVLPAGLSLHVIAEDHVLGLARDSLGVERVVGYRFVR